MSEQPSQERPWEKAWHDWRDGSIMPCVRIQGSTPDEPFAIGAPEWFIDRIVADHNARLSSSAAAARLQFHPSEVTDDGWPTERSSMQQLYLLTGADDDETVLAIAANELMRLKRLSTSAAAAQEGEYANDSNLVKRAEWQNSYLFECLNDKEAKLAVAVLNAITTKQGESYAPGPTTSIEGVWLPKADYDALKKAQEWQRRARWHSEFRQNETRRAEAAEAEVARLRACLRRIDQEATPHPGMGGYYLGKLAHDALTATAPDQPDSEET